MKKGVIIYMVFAIIFMIMGSAAAYSYASEQGEPIALALAFCCTILSIWWFIVSIYLDMDD